jgi:very-short-patch-repair endonuclease
MFKRTIFNYNPKLKERSGSLRKNITDAERCSWSQVRRKQVRGLQFYRQRPIGNYIVDFYCPDVKLVIEVDGGQHYSEEGCVYDRERDQYLKGNGLAVLRFTNME